MPTMSFVGRAALRAVLARRQALLDARRRIGAHRGDRRVVAARGRGHLVQEQPEVPHVGVVVLREVAPAVHVDEQAQPVILAQLAFDFLDRRIDLRLLFVEDPALVVELDEVQRVGRRALARGPAARGVDASGAIGLVDRGVRLAQRDRVGGGDVGLVRLQRRAGRERERAGDDERDRRGPLDAGGRNKPVSREWFVVHRSLRSGSGRGAAVQIRPRAGAEPNEARRPRILNSVECAGALPSFATTSKATSSAGR
jgi:hypothetical protein